MSDLPRFNDDFIDMVRSLTEAGVVFMVVGAHALAAHGIVRASGDLDIFVRPDPKNAKRVVAALHGFGAPLAAHGVSERDFATPGAVYQLGLPPNRIDVLTELSGLDYETAAAGRVHVRTEGVEFFVPSAENLLVNKKASGRPQDLEDARRLERLLAER